MNLRIVFALLLLMGCVPAPAQSEHPSLDKREKLLIVLDAGVRALDVYSTHRALDGPNHEMLLPSSIARNPTALATLEFSDVLGVLLASRTLARHHHDHAAHLLTEIDAASDAPWAIHNLFLDAGTKPVIIIPGPSPFPIPKPD